MVFVQGEHEEAVKRKPECRHEGVGGFKAGVESFASHLKAVSRRRRVSRSPATPKPYDRKP